MDVKTRVSIIVPIYNGSPWIDNCFNSILQQQLTAETELEVCVCNDASNDDTPFLLDKWIKIFSQHHICLRIFSNSGGTPKGVGYAKNRAIEISTGTYLCFQDIDDIMLPNRIAMQYEKAKTLPENTIIGSQFKRIPENSTSRYTNWANSLSRNKLHVQIYTSHGPTVIMPTWFCHRKVFEIGGFCEQGMGTPEDLIFFYKHIDSGGRIFRVEECLLIYTYHVKAATFSVKESTIWKIRLKRLEDAILNRWDKFVIWNAGKQGRQFYNSLSELNQEKVVAFCDVDTKKIGKKYIPFNSGSRTTGKEIDIIHFKKAVPPFVICVKIVI